MDRRCLKAESALHEAVGQAQVIDAVRSIIGPLRERVNGSLSTYVSGTSIVFLSYDKHTLRCIDKLTETPMVVGSDPQLSSQHHPPYIRLAFACIGLAQSPFDRRRVFE